MSGNETLNYYEVQAQLILAVNAAGGVSKWAKAKGMSHTPVSLMYSGQRPVSEPVANALGFFVETRYRRIR
jgi:hypothetical protein